MTLVSPYYVHFLARRDLGSGQGWYAPAELDSDDPQGTGLVIPVNHDGVPFDEYWMGVLFLEGAKRTIEYFSFTRDNTTGSFKLETVPADIQFVERQVPPEQRALRYLGEFQFEDLKYPLVEITPVKDTIYDLLLGSKEVVLIGCNPFELYRRKNGTRL